MQVASETAEAARVAAGSFGKILNAQRVERNAENFGALTCISIPGLVIHLTLFL
jgi:hypothetical protein